MGLFGDSSGTTREKAFVRIHEVQAELNFAYAEEYLEDGEPAQGVDHQRSAASIDSLQARVTVADIGDQLVVEYYGPDYGAPWNIFAKLIGEQNVADHIGVLRVGGPDQGANGTRTYDFSKTLAKKPVFPMLKELWIRPSEAGDHNFSEVAEGQIHRLLKTMPAVEQVTLPNAPDKKFFKLGLLELRMLRIGSNFATRAFIRNMAESNGFPKLHFLDFADSLEPWMSFEPTDDPDYQAASFKDYEVLFKSSVIDSFWGLRLRNTQLKEKEYKMLQKLRPELQFSVIFEPPHGYVSHWNGIAFPHKHLVPRG